MKDQKHYIVAGSYTDTLRRVADGWRIAHRRQTIVWAQGDGSVVGL